MKVLLSIVLTALTAFAAGLYFPWWSLAITSFLVAVMSNRSAGMSFLSGFLGVFLLWSIMATTISISNDHILAHRMSQVIIQKDAPVVLILLTGIVGGLAAGMAAWFGASVRSLFRQD